MPELHVAQIGIHLRGTRIDGTEYLLHHMERVTLLDHLGATCVAQLVQYRKTAYQNAILLMRRCVSRICWYGLCWMWC